MYSLRIQRMWMWVCNQTPAPRCFCYVLLPLGVTEQFAIHWQIRRIQIHQTVAERRPASEQRWGSNTNAMHTTQSIECVILHVMQFNRKCVYLFDNLQCHTNRQKVVSTSQNSDASVSLQNPGTICGDLRPAERCDDRNAERILEWRSDWYSIGGHVVCVGRDWW